MTLAESKRSSTPTPLARYHVAPEGIGGSEAGPVFRGDHRFPVAVILSYHPLFLNNDSLFASPMTTTLTPPGYRVSPFTNGCIELNDYGSLSISLSLALFLRSLSLSMQGRRI